ncbi:FAD binding domain-containing protein [Bacillus spongiae]|uniref:FAD binding domain-containing protein n=1 Tax=Bacillus spongiae TaxID=2683610 RepID=A0ABU8HIP3_9BACI
MIPFDFEYFQPSSITEAIQLFQQLYEKQKGPLYYGGGTEFTTLGRFMDLTRAVIDIKKIPECNIIEQNGSELVVGAALTLTKLAEDDRFPLLSQVVANVADRTARNQITLGGNINGMIPYREGVLPFLVCDSTCVIAGKNGLRYEPIQQLFKKRLRLEKGEFLVQLRTPLREINAPFYYVKKRKIDKIDYPLISMASIKKEHVIQFAFSGLCAFPFRSIPMEKTLNNQQLPLKKRINQAFLMIPAPIKDDIRGSRAYREFVLQEIVTTMIETLEGGTV